MCVEFWGGHIGTSDQKFAANDNDWIPLPQPQNTPTPPECYFRNIMGNPPVPIPVDHLKHGRNIFRFTCGPQMKYSFDDGHYGVYAFTVRVHYDPAARPHPTGRIADPAPGATIGEFPLFSTEFESGGAPVTRIEFVGNYEDFNRSGSGRFREWHYQLRTGRMDRRIAWRNKDAQRSHWACSTPGACRQNLCSFARYPPLKSTPKPPIMNTETQLVSGMPPEEKGELVMGIQPVERPVADYPRRPRPPSHEPEAGEMRGERGGEIRPETVEAPRPTAESEQTGEHHEQDTGDGRAGGVLRLLQAGHFRGVADVRLRINFHDELQAPHAAQAQQTAEAAVQQLSQEVTAAVDAAAAEEALPEGTVEDVRELAGNFAAEARQAAADSAGHPEVFLTGLRDAFGRFTEGVAALAPQGAETEPETSDGGDIVQPAALQNFIEGLEGIFAHVLEGFEQETEQDDGLPPPSQPPGNGSVYERFLAIYNSLHAVHTDHAEPPQDETTDVTA